MLVMSARSFQFPGGGDKSSYDAEMKLWIAAGHNLQALLAADGRRVAFPAQTHGDLFRGARAGTLSLVTSSSGEFVERKMV